MLERLSVHTRDIGTLISANRECVQGAVVLATCNRFEAYIDMDEPVTAGAPLAIEAALLAIEEATGVTPAELEHSYEIVEGPGVVEHLFAVSSGLESVVVGEGEIAGQVRRALEQAREHGTTSSELERLFQRATHTSRGVKNATPLGRAGRSLVRLALDLAESRIADWSRLQVLMVGTGAYAAATLAALRDHGVQNVTVHSPSGRGERFAFTHGITHVDAAAYPRVAASADLVVTCTTSEAHVLDAAILRQGAADARAWHEAGVNAATSSIRVLPVSAVATTFGAVNTASSSADSGARHEQQPGFAGETCPLPHGRRLIIDLGLPRNVDPDVVGVEGIDLLDLETIRIHAPLEELQATDDARAMVRIAARDFAEAGQHQAVTPAVVALRDHVFELLEQEISRARGRGDQGETAQALRHLVGVLLHTPTVRARELSREGRADAYVEGIEAVFGIDARAAVAAAAKKPGLAASTGSADEAVAS